MIWDALTAIAAVISVVAVIITTLFLRDQVKGQQKDRFLNVTNDLFAIWLAADFMEAQLWLLHRMEETTWADFIARHRGDKGEVSFHRVGSFYDRVGTLVRLGFVNDREILSTIGGHAIAVWARIGPLVLEARRIENSALFDDFEHLLPACRECYVPSLTSGESVLPFSLDQPGDLVTPKELRRRIKSGETLTLLDVRQPSQVDRANPVIPNSVHIPPDSVIDDSSDLPADRPTIVLCA